MKKFKLQIVGILGALVIATVVSLISLSYYEFRSESIKLTKFLLRADNDKIKTELIEKFNGYKRTLSFVDASPEDFSRGQLSMHLVSQLQTLYNIQKDITNGIFIFKKNGDLYDQNGKKLDVNVKSLDREYYDGIFNQGKTFFVSTPYISSTNNKKVFGVTYKINPDTAILSSIYLDAVLGHLTNKEGMFIYSTDGTILSSQYKDLLGKNIFSERPHYKSFNKNNPELSYSIKVNNEEDDFTAFWNQLEINDWNFVTYIKDSKIKEAANSQLKSSVMIGVLSLLIVILILLFVVNTLILKPVGGAPEEIATMMEKMAEGDLTQELKKSGQETGIYRSLIHLSEELSQLVKTSHNISENVSAASQELNTVMENTLENSEHELDQVEQISTAINELSSTSLEVSDKAVMAEDERKKHRAMSKKGN